MGLIFDEAEEPVLSEEEINDTGGFIDTYNDQFVSTEPITEPEPEISEEQLERMRQNMENAKRLREEKLRQIGGSTQNNVDVHNQMDTQDSGSIECGNITNVTNNDVSRNKTYESNEMLTEDIADSEQEVEDNDDIDNILDYINEDDVNELTENANSSIIEPNNMEKSNNDSIPNNKLNDENVSLMEIENPTSDKEFESSCGALNFGEINTCSSSFPNQQENVSVTDSEINSQLEAQSQTISNGCNSQENVDYANSDVENVRTSNENST